MTEYDKQVAGKKYWKRRARLDWLTPLALDAILSGRGYFLTHDELVLVISDLKEEEARGIGEEDRAYTTTR